MFLIKNSDPSSEDSFFSMIKYYHILTFHPPRHFPQARKCNFSLMFYCWILLVPQMSISIRLTTYSYSLNTSRLSLYFPASSLTTKQIRLR